MAVTEGRMIENIWVAFDVVGSEWSLSVSLEKVKSR